MQQNIKKNSSKIIISNLIVYSIIHAIVDACCAAIIAYNVNVFKSDVLTISYYIVLYNTIAFALQVPIGMIVDKVKKPILSAIIGCILVISGMVIYKNLTSSLILLGLGNACFHIGGGIISLRMKPESATFSGVFVAPGAIGLLIGTLYGTSTNFSILMLIVLLILSVLSILFLKEPSLKKYKQIESKENNKFTLILLCMFISICIRSFIGFVINYPWKASVFLLVIYTIAISLGKALGGLLGDIAGWRKVTLTGLIISAPLIVLGVNNPLLGVLGIFFFNLTMPITLTAISCLFNSRFGFAFGMTTLALIIGALPIYTTLKDTLYKYNNNLIIISIVFMVGILNIGLKLLNKRGNI